MEAHCALLADRAPAACPSRTRQRDGSALVASIHPSRGEAGGGGQWTACSSARRRGARQREGLRWILTVLIPCKGCDPIGVSIARPGGCPIAGRLGRTPSHAASLPRECTATGSSGAGSAAAAEDGYHGCHGGFHCP